MIIGKIVDCLQRLGYKSLTEIQRASLLEIYGKGRSAIIVAPTGSGKTEAAVFPVMLKIRTRNLKPVAAIYVTPLRALNRDIARRLEEISRCFEINVGVRHGDTPASIRKSIALNPPHILITTPESFNYIVMNDELRRHLANTEFIVIDEYRDLMESKRGLLFFTTLYLLEKIIGKRLTKIALTATLHDDKLALELLRDPAGDSLMLIKDPNIRNMEIEVRIPSCETQLCRDINEIMENEDLSAKISDILDKIREDKYILIFTNTRSLAESLTALIRDVTERLNLNIKLDVHHGSLSRQHRERIEKEFRERKLNAIVATSSLELGIDIGHVEYVVQYSSPRQATRLTQRVGRSRHRYGETSRGMIITSDNLLQVLEASVLAWNAMNGQLEKEMIIPKPLDVLAYAIALYTYLNPGVSTSQVLEVMKGHPLFADLTETEFNEVIDYLKYTRILREELNHLYPTKKTHLYLYRVSMIPSTREVDVVETATGRKIGSLDEEYVVVYLNPEDAIVLAGRTWRIVSYNEVERKLYVEPVQSTSDVVIPHWEGENIPVEYEVAQEVGRAIEYYKKNGSLPDHLVRFIRGELSVSKETVQLMSDHGSIYVDYIEEFNLVIINVYGGTRVNALIRDLLRYLLKTRYPYLRITAYSAPYYIIFQLSGASMLDIGPSPVVFIYDVLRNIANYSSMELINRVARESTQYLWRIYQVAQRFGAISPEATHVNRRLLEAFDETIIGKEALKEVLIKDYDINSFFRLIDRIGKGEVSVELRRFEKIQDHHAILFGYIDVPALRELQPPDLTSFFDKLLNRHVTLLCIRCGFTMRDRIKEIMKNDLYACPRCKTATLSVVKGDTQREVELVKKLRRGDKLSGDEERLREELVERAILLYRYRDVALLTLSIPGVIARDASRIISQYVSGEDLMKLLYEYEKRFVKIKKYLNERKQPQQQ